MERKLNCVCGKHDLIYIKPWRRGERKKEGKKERKPPKIAITVVKFSGVSRYRINMQKLVASHTLTTSY